MASDELFVPRVGDASGGPGGRMLSLALADVVTIVHGKS